MKIEDIVIQLRRALPRLTSNYHTELAVESLTSSGLVATCTTVNPHGLSTGDVVSISGTIVPNELTGLTAVNGLAYGTTLRNHDLTLKYQKTITITGADQPEYNGTFYLVDVPNRKNFVYELTAPIAVPATGAPLLLENLNVGYNGLQSITVTGIDTFTFAISKELGSPAYGDISLKVRPRITGAIDVNYAVNSYNKFADGSYYLYVALHDESGSRDRLAVSDSTAEIGSSHYYQQGTYQQFSVYLFIPSKLYVGGRFPRDVAEDEKLNICKSLLGTSFDLGFETGKQNGIVLVKSGSALYAESYYVHEFLFEITGQITGDFIYLEDTSVAFRDIYFDFNLILPDNEESEQVSQLVDLDDDPISED